jgi:hypothetical protein
LKVGENHHAITPLVVWDISQGSVRGVHLGEIAQVGAERPIDLRLDGMHVERIVESFHWLKEPAIG